MVLPRDAKEKPPEGSSDRAALMKCGTWLKPTLPDPPPLGSVDGVALYEPLVHIDHDCDSIRGIGRAFK
jgi:hypothetical protein